MRDLQIKKQMAEFRQRKPFDPPKKKPVPTQKDPNLSPQERKVVYDDNMPESSWNKLQKNSKLTGKPITDQNINNALRANQKKDSAHVVNNRYNHRTFSITSTGSTPTGGYKNKGVSHRPEGSNPKEYGKNKFWRDKNTGELKQTEWRN